MHVRGVIFDLDDTLYPHDRFIQSGFAAVARRLWTDRGVPAGQALRTLQEARATTPGREMQTVCEIFGLPAALVPDLVDIHRTHDPELWLYHDALPALERLRADGWRIAILTNGLPHVQAAKVRALGLRARVDHLIYAAEYADGGKPHADCFAEALRRMRLPADRVVMVGDDRTNDIAGARAAGLRTIEINRSPLPSPSPADLALQALTDLPAAAAALLAKEHAHAA